VLQAKNQAKTGETNMQTHLQTDAELDDQALAPRRISAYRRCKEMNPRWMLEERASPQPAVAPYGADAEQGRSAPSKSLKLPSLH
jgi:hypothetical protein